jgi:hypothetical protein
MSAQDPSRVLGRIRELLQREDGPGKLLQRLWQRWCLDTPKANLDWAADSDAVSWALAEILPVPLSVKQLYLEMELSERLTRQLAFLNSKYEDLSYRGALLKKAMPVPEEENGT